MLISKEKFINYLSKYKEALEEKDRFQDALEPFFDFPVVKLGDSLIDAYEGLLVEVSECGSYEDGIFSWWYWESPNDGKIITVKEKDGTKVDYDVTTAEGLYDYLVTYYGDKK